MLASIKLNSLVVLPSGRHESGVGRVILEMKIKSQNLEIVSKNILIYQNDVIQVVVFTLRNE